MIVVFLGFLVVTVFTLSLTSSFLENRKERF